MLTQPEMASARDDLRQAVSLAVDVREVFFCAGYVQGARVLKNVIDLLSDEIAALDKAISGAKP